MAFRKGNSSVIILALCALIIVRMVDFAIFDADGHVFEHDVNIFVHDIQLTELSHEELEENALQHSNEHDMHDIYHSVLSVYLQATVENFDEPNLTSIISETGYGKISKSISFNPPVPPPLA